MDDMTLKSFLKQERNRMWSEEEIKRLKDAYDSLGDNELYNPPKNFELLYLNENKEWLNEKYKR